MLHLRRCILTCLLSSPATSISPLHRLLSAAAPAVSPTPRFAVDEHLVDACGLSRAEALKAAAKLSHLRYPTKPDAVLAFLADLGLSGADVAALVRKDPLFLCTGVDRTLRPNVVELTGLGLSHAEVARLVSLAPNKFRCRSIVSKLQYYLPLLGSSEKFLKSLSYNSHLLTSSHEKVIKPNAVFMQECGLGACDIPDLFLYARLLLTKNPESLRAIVASAEGFGVPRGSRMFRYALEAVEHLGVDKISAKVEYLKNTFRWSDAEVRIAVSKFPKILARSKDILQSRSEFLISEVGLEPAYIAHRPALLSYGLEGRLRPRYYVVKFLKENGLLDRDRSYYSAVMVTEKVFMEKFISPHDEAAPHLAEDYAAACRGEVPTNFRFALTEDGL